MLLEEALFLQGGLEQLANVRRDVASLELFAVALERLAHLIHQELFKVPKSVANCLTGCQMMYLGFAIMLIPSWEGKNIFSVKRQNSNVKPDFHVKMAQRNNQDGKFRGWYLFFFFSFLKKDNWLMAFLVEALF